MRFSVISPVAGLQKFSALSKTHLTLAHVDNPIYWQFYKEKSDQGDLVILDNSAYEGQMNTKLILDRIARSRPKVVVLPDITGGEPIYNLSIAMSFLKEHARGYPVEWMFVPQARSVRDLDALHQSIEAAIERYAITWIGLPRHLITHAQISRAQVCGWIKSIWPHVYVHALGMCNGSLEELKALQETECNSIDSSAPVWRGWNGRTLGKMKDQLWWNDSGTECNFDIHPNSLTNENELLIYNNLRKVGVNVLTSNTPTS